MATLWWIAILALLVALVYSCIRAVRCFRDDQLPPDRSRR